MHLYSPLFIEMSFGNSLKLHKQGKISILAHTLFNHANRSVLKMECRLRTTDYGLRTGYKTWTEV